MPQRRELHTEGNAKQLAKSRSSSLITTNHTSQLKSGTGSTAGRRAMRPAFAGKQAMAPPLRGNVEGVPGEGARAGAHPWAPVDFGELTLVYQSTWATALMAASRTVLMEHTGWKGQRAGELSEKLGSCSEVDIVRAHCRARLLIKGDVPSESLEFRARPPYAEGKRGASCPPSRAVRRSRKLENWPLPNFA